MKNCVYCLLLNYLSLHLLPPHPSPRAWEGGGGSREEKQCQIRNTLSSYMLYWVWKGCPTRVAKFRHSRSPPPCFHPSKIAKIPTWRCLKLRRMKTMISHFVEQYKLKSSTTINNHSQITIHSSCGGPQLQQGRATVMFCHVSLCYDPLTAPPLVLPCSVRAQ